MAVKTFTQAEQLTAADTNTYLANGGLVYVGGGSFTTTANADFDNVFTSTYDDYRIVLTYTAISASNTQFFRFIDSAGSVVTTNNYDYQLFENDSTTLTGLRQMASNATRISYGYQTPGYMAATIDLFGPFLARPTLSISAATSINGTTSMVADDVKGYFRLATQMRGIRFLPGGGTISGNAKIFGVRQA
jgi:hypothetical protein